MKKSSLLCAVLACVGLSTVGCVSHRQTVHRETSRVKVEFENEKAAHIFYEKVRVLPASNTSESSTSFCIPLVFEHKRTVKTDDHAQFNDAVRRCDTNQDSRITEQEARIFAAQQ